MEKAAWYERFKVDVPEGESGRVRVERFVVEDERNLTNMRYAMAGMRTVPEGTWTRITEGGTLWMSDTPSEIIDHIHAIREMEKRGGRVAINGLGVGVVTQAALRAPTVERVDVVELSEAVISLVGPHYTALAEAEGKELVIHHADALTMRWPVGTRFDVAWHDIWPDITTDNLETMGTLHRKYGRISAWQGSWRREYLQSERRRYAASGWY